MYASLYLLKKHKIAIIFMNQVMFGEGEGNMINIHSASMN